MQCGWHSLSFLSAVTTLPKREKAPCPECFLRRCCPGWANCRWKQGVDVKQQWQKSEGDSMNHLPVLDVWFLCFKDFTFCARFVCMCAGYGAPAETPADKQVSTKRIFGMFENKDHWHFCFCHPNCEIQQWHGIPPGKQTWHWKINMFNQEIYLQMVGTCPLSFVSLSGTVTFEDPLQVSQIQRHQPCFKSKAVERPVYWPRGKVEAFWLGKNSTLFAY